MKFPFGNKKQKDNSENFEDNSEKRSVFSSEFFGKLGEFFNPEPQKEKVLRHEDFAAAGDTYYATVSAGYKISQRILIVILVIFLVFSLVTNFNEITFDNFFYMIKDFNTAVDMESTNYDTLSYDSNTRHFFSLFRGGLTVVNPSNLSVFTATGRRTMQTTSQFSSPCVESSGKYFIIYDTAGTTFSIYNSFSRIYTETLDYPVTGACFAENGNMAVITRDTSHKSLIHVYNKNFKKLFTVPYSMYAFDVEMNSDADKTAISYYDIGDGSGRTEIRIMTMSTAEDYETISIDGEFLLECGFLSEEIFAVVTDRSIRVYDKNFQEYDAQTYYNGVVSGYHVNEYGAAVSYTYNSENIAIVFDKKGNLLYNESVNNNIKDISVYEEYIFLRTDDGVVRIKGSNNDEQFLIAGKGQMLIYSADTVLVCGDSKAEYLVFEDE